MFEEVRESIGDELLDEEDFKKAVEESERRAMEYYRSNCSCWSEQSCGGTTDSENSLRQSIAAKKSQYISKHEKVLMNNIRESIVPSSLSSTLRNTEVLRIGNYSYSDSSVTELKLSGLVQLKQIVIGDKCFGSVRVFELNGLFDLESVVIGEESFTYANRDNDIRCHVTRTDGSHRIVNCPKLKSIQIGDYSFADYHSFELNNLPSLQSIEIGVRCFYWTPSFSLTGLNSQIFLNYNQSSLVKMHSIMFIRLCLRVIEWMD